jgi:hypothetical protein
MPEDNQTFALSHPTAERVREVGLQVADRLVTRLEDELFKPYVARLESPEDYYHCVALAQTAIIEVLRVETSHAWESHNLEASIQTHWGEHRSKRVNRKIQKGHSVYLQSFTRSQRSVLSTGMNDLLANRIVRVSFEELEMDPLAVDFEPLSGEGVIKRHDISY